MEIVDVGLKFNGSKPNGGEQKHIDSIIVHHAAGNGSVEDIHSLHLKQGWWGIGYHYYIRKDGKIYQGRPEKCVGSHAGSSNDYNKHSIGVCFEGNFEIETPTEAQIDAGRWLIADIKSRYQIKEILPHKAITATACPGKNLDVNRLLVTARYAVFFGQYDTEEEAKEIASALERIFGKIKVIEI